jgi:Cu2+-exporting ATPase
MKTATLDVGGMLSVLDYHCVEKQLRKMPGVQRVTASIASNSMTLEFDETVTSVAALRDKINACGFHCTGEIMPKHVCKSHCGHADEHGMHAAHGAPMKAAGPKPGTPAGRVPHEHHPAHAPAEAPAAARRAMPMPHDMAHEMGHGAGMDMAEMVRDMRNRFWISLVFTVPIFIYSPMGNLFTPPAPPFGLKLDLWLFFVASAAILYPAWPFVVAAVRALRNGVLKHGGAGPPQRGDRLPVQRRRHLLFPRRSVLRGIGRPARLHPARPLAGDAGASGGFGSHPGAARSGAAHGDRASRRPGS